MIIDFCTKSTSENERKSATHNSIKMKCQHLLSKFEDDLQTSAKLQGNQTYHRHMLTNLERYLNLKIEPCQAQSLKVCGFLHV